MVVISHVYWCLIVISGTNIYNIQTPIITQGTNGKYREVVALLGGKLYPIGYEYDGITWGCIGINSLGYNPMSVAIEEFVKQKSKEYGITQIGLNLLGVKMCGCGFLKCLIRQRKGFV